MEIIKILTEFMLKMTGREELGPLLAQLEKNGFDLKKTVSALTPDTVIPVIKSFLQKASDGKKSDSFAAFGSESFGTEPVSEIADSRILRRLNDYLG